jgi:hypothetical protein
MKAEGERGQGMGDGGWAGADAREPEPWFLAIRPEIRKIETILPRFTLDGKIDSSHIPHYSTPI